MYDKGVTEQNVILDVIDDLDQVDAAARLGSKKELNNDIELLLRNFADLNKEYNKIKSITIIATNNNNEEEKDHTAVTVVTTTNASSQELFLQNISSYITKNETDVESIKNNKIIFNTKINELIEYFGEDVESNDIMNVFSVLSDFRRAMITSKDTIARKMKMAAAAAQKIATAANSNLQKK